MRKMLLLRTIVLLLSTGVVGQYQLRSEEEVNTFNSIPKEEIFLHFNDNLLFSGEYLYYSFYGLNASNHSPSRVSKIGYVTLLDKNDSAIFKQKIELVNGIGHGDFFIPTDIQTGHYKLIGYTRWMQNEMDTPFFEGDVIIVNPYLELPIATDSLKSGTIRLSKVVAAPAPVRTNDPEPFTIHLPKTTYGKRQAVKFDLQQAHGGSSGVVSISVRKKGTANTPFTKKSSRSPMTRRQPTVFKIDDTVFLPELRGELISGQLHGRSDSTFLANRDISLSIPGKEGVTKVSQSSEEGIFYFNLHMGNRNDQVIFKLLGEQEEAFDISIHAVDPPLKSTDFKRITIDPNLNRSFEERSIYNQIENAFFELKADSTFGSPMARPAYKDFQERYLLDDYTRFSTLQETIVEIIDDVVVKKRNGQYEIRIRRNEAFFVDIDEEPLVLVDNVLVENVSALFDYNMAQVRQIGISRKTFYVGPKKYQGVFAMETHADDTTLPTTGDGAVLKRIPGPIRRRKYFTQNYTNTPADNSAHTADFRQQLLWLPYCRLEGTKPIEFYTSDNSGTYEIAVEGFTDNGKPISLSARLQIE